MAQTTFPSSVWDGTTDSRGSFSVSRGPDGIDWDRAVEEIRAIQDFLLNGAGTVSGTISMYGGSVAPTGWQLCDGTSLLVATEPTLFTAIGYAFGGSGANFNVPDLRGRGPTGVGTGVGLDAIALADSDGVQDTTLIEGNLPTHTHLITPRANSTGADDSAPGSRYISKHKDTTETDFLEAFANTHNINMGTYTSGSAGSDTPFTNRSPYVGVNFIIKK